MKKRTFEDVLKDPFATKVKAADQPNEEEEKEQAVPANISEEIPEENNTENPNLKVPKNEKGNDGAVKKINKKFIKGLVYTLTGILVAIVFAYIIIEPQEAEETLESDKSVSEIKDAYGIDSTDYIRVKEQPLEEIEEDSKQAAAVAQPKPKPTPAKVEDATYDYTVPEDEVQVQYVEKPVTEAVPSRQEYYQKPEEKDEKPTMFTGIGAARTSPQSAPVPAKNPAQDILAGYKNQQAYDAQNAQERKKQFLEHARTNNTSPYLEAVATEPISPYILHAGTIIPIILITGINSDLPGQIVGQVIANVYDSKRGNYLLIPAGSKVLGNYDSSVTYGQKRLLVVWERLIYPNGRSINLRGMPGIDVAGYAGYNDKLDAHIDELALLFGVSTVLGIGNSLAETASESVSNKYLKSLTKSLTGNAEQTTGLIEKIADKTLNKQPTIIIRRGKRVNILINKDMVLPPYVRRK